MPNPAHMDAATDGARALSSAERRCSLQDVRARLVPAGCRAALSGCRAGFRVASSDGSGQARLITGAMPWGLNCGARGTPISTAASRTWSIADAPDATFMTFRLIETDKTPGIVRAEAGIERYTFRDGRIALKDCLIAKSAPSLRPRHLRPATRRNLVAMSPRRLRGLFRSCHCVMRGTGPGRCRHVRRVIFGGRVPCFWPCCLSCWRRAADPAAGAGDWLGLGQWRSQDDALVGAAGAMVGSPVQPGRAALAMAGTDIGHWRLVDRAAKSSPRRARRIDARFQGAGAGGAGRSGPPHDLPRRLDAFRHRRDDGGPAGCGSIACGLRRQGRRTHSRWPGQGHAAAGGGPTGPADQGRRPVAVRRDHSATGPSAGAIAGAHARPATRRPDRCSPCPAHRRGTRRAIGRRHRAQPSATRAGGDRGPDCTGFRAGSRPNGWPIRRRQARRRWCLCPT